MDVSVGDHIFKAEQGNMIWLYTEWYVTPINISIFDSCDIGDNVRDKRTTGTPLKLLTSKIQEAKFDITESYCHTDLL